VEVEMEEEVVGEEGDEGKEVEEERQMLMLPLNDGKRQVCCHRHWHMVMGREELCWR